MIRLFHWQVVAGMMAMTEDMVEDMEEGMEEEHQVIITILLTLWNSDAAVCLPVRIDVFTFLILYLTV